MPAGSSVKQHRIHIGIWRTVIWYRIGPQTGRVWAEFSCGHRKKIGTLRRCGIGTAMRTEKRRCRECLPKETTT